MFEGSRWLGAGPLDEVIRDAAPDDDKCCALSGIGSAAVCVLSRERFARGSNEHGYRWPRYITNNRRYFTLDPQSRPNRTSCALGVTFPRLSADFGDRFSMHHDWHEYPLEKL